MRRHLIPVVFVLAMAACGDASRPMAPFSTNPAAPSPAPRSRYTVSGLVTERTGPVPGVTVTASGSFGESVAVTDSSGFYSLHARGTIHLTADKPGYEQFLDHGLTFTVTRDVTFNPQLQALFLLSEDARMVTTLYPDDFPYYVGEASDSDYCGPCKLFRIRPQQSGMMNITLRWDGAANLGAWALDGMVKAIAVPGVSELTIPLKGGVEEDIKLYVGLPLRGQSPQSLARETAVEVITALR
jgi:hypothetical protein